MTVDQARLYLALLQCGPATARQLADASKIARPDIYRIIPTIEKQGMVEKLMTRPISYQAVPAILVLPNMIKRKATEQTILIKETEELLANLRCNEARESQDEDTSSVMVYGKNGVIQRLKVGLARASVSVCIVTSRERFSDAILEFADEYRECFEERDKNQYCNRTTYPKKIHSTNHTTFCQEHKFQSQIYYVISASGNDCH